MKPMSLFFVIRAESDNDEVTFQCFAPETEAGAARFRASLEEVRKQSGMQLLKVRSTDEEGE